MFNFLTWITCHMSVASVGYSCKARYMIAPGWLPASQCQAAVPCFCAVAAHKRRMRAAAAGALLVLLVVYSVATEGEKFSFRLPTPCTLLLFTVHDLCVD